MLGGTSQLACTARYSLDSPEIDLTRMVQPRVNFKRLLTSPEFWTYSRRKSINVEYARKKRLCFSSFLSRWVGAGNARHMYYHLHAYYDITTPSCALGVQQVKQPQQQPTLHT